MLTKTLLIWLIWKENQQTLNSFSWLVLTLIRSLVAPKPHLPVNDENVNVYLFFENVNVYLFFWRQNLVQLWDFYGKWNYETLLIFVKIYAHQLLYLWGWGQMALETCKICLCWLKTNVLLTSFYNLHT